MTTISLTDIQQDLAGYLHRVQAGESFVVVENNKPVAKIDPVIEREGGLRPAGLCQGEFVTPDDFDEPLPDEIQQEFEGA